MLKRTDFSKAAHQKICLNMSGSFKTNKRKKNPECYSAVLKTNCKS